MSTLIAVVVVVVVIVVVRVEFFKKRISMSAAPKPITNTTG